MNGRATPAEQPAGLPGRPRVRSRATMPCTVLHALTQAAAASASLACGRSRRPPATWAGARSARSRARAPASSTTASPRAGDADAVAALGAEHRPRGAQPAQRARQPLGAGTLDLRDLLAQLARGARPACRRPRPARGRAAPRGRPARPRPGSASRRERWCRARGARRRAGSTCASRCSGSRPTVGSSRIRRSGWCRVARAMSSQPAPAAGELAAPAARARGAEAGALDRVRHRRAGERVRRGRRGAAANRRFSSTVSSPSMLVSWNTQAEPAADGRALAHRRRGRRRRAARAWARAASPAAASPSSCRRRWDRAGRRRAPRGDREIERRRARARRRSRARARRSRSAEAHARCGSAITR